MYENLADAVCYLSVGGITPYKCQTFTLRANLDMPERL